MTPRYLPIAAALALAVVAGCDNLTPEQRTLAGITGGAAAGLITADVLNASSEWRVIAALAGAAAGTLVANNVNNSTCAYARGDGTYYTAPCPR